MNAQPDGQSHGLYCKGIINPKVDHAQAMQWLVLGSCSVEDLRRSEMQRMAKKCYLYRSSSTNSIELEKYVS